MGKLQGLEKKYEELVQEFEKLKKQKLQEKWTPKQEEIYYFIGDCGEADCSTWYNDEIDNYRRDYLRIFKTESDVQEYLDYIKARKETSYEFSKEEWENSDIEKYHICYGYIDKELDISSNEFVRSLGNIYFKAEADAQEFIDKYEKQIKKFEFGIEEE